MAQGEIVPFTHEHVDGAAALLVERLTRQRAAERLLAPTDPVDAIGRLVERGDVGAVAVRDNGAIEAFILARFDENEIFGRNAWVDAAGSATRDPELLRDVYGFVATEWVDDGRLRHFAVVPVLPEDLDPWYRLGFHQMQVYGITETRPTSRDLPKGLSIREAGVDDLDDVVRIDVLIFQHQQRPPSFGLMQIDPDMEERRADWKELLEDESFRVLVAERDGRIVGHTSLELEAAPFAFPADAIVLGSSAVDPATRGSGIGVALVEHAFAKAAELGHPSIRTDWRVTNLLASRFWPARGFRPVYLRMHRAVGIG